MSNIDKRALREAAEKATKGQWAVEFDDEIYSTDGVNHEQIAMVFSENEASDAAFIAAANPVTVLALLDELEPMALAHLNLNLLCDVYRSAYEEARHDGLVNWEAAASLAEENEELKRKLEAAEKRIAELERNEIREEGNQFLVVRHPGKLPVVKHCAGELEGFLRQLLEHDPMATIDIITHRYYGVGGQWVQDADEYLQMMAAAAGKGEAS